MVAMFLKGFNLNRNLGGRRLAIEINVNNLVEKIYRNPPFGIVPKIFYINT